MKFTYFNKFHCCFHVAENTVKMENVNEANTHQANGFGQQLKADEVQEIVNTSGNGQNSSVRPKNTKNIIKKCQSFDTSRKAQAPIPSKENGKRGKVLDFIESNHLKVNTDKIVDCVYRYEVSIKMKGPDQLRTKAFLKFCAEHFSKHIVYDECTEIAFSPCELNIGQSIRHTFVYSRPDTENDWKKSKKTHSIRLNKVFDCEVRMWRARPFFIPIKRVLAG